jgi:CRISPR-associated protein Csd2
MSVRGLGVFEHETALGNAPANQLFELIRVEGPETPRSFGEYHITGPGALPAGVKFRWVVNPNGNV